MGIVNTESNTRVDEIADRIYRISTPVSVIPGGFTFNQFLIVDDEPLLFHTGLRRIFPLVREALAKVIPVDSLRWVSFSHHEADENGSLEDWLAVAPQALPLCGRLGAMLSVEDLASRAPRALADGEQLSIGRKSVRWFDTPHLPHGWDAGYLAETTTRTLFCGDILTQAGAAVDPVTEGDVLGPSEAVRHAMDYYSNPRAAGVHLERLAATEPALLACMHGSSYRGNGAAALRALARALEETP